MKKIRLFTVAAILLSMFAFTLGTAHADDKFITLGWAAWDPANALVELSKDFTKQTGIKVKFEFVPWPNFADRMLNELNQGGKTFDVLIGDSQWIGGGAVYGHYVKLNDFFDKEGISMDNFLAPHRLRLFDLAKRHPKLLRFACFWRCQCLDLSKGLV